MNSLQPSPTHLKSTQILIFYHEQPLPCETNETRAKPVVSCHPRNPCGSSDECLLKAGWVCTKCRFEIEDDWGQHSN